MNEILFRLLDQQKSGSCCDVAFLVSNERVYGHHYILAPMSQLVKHSGTQQCLLTFNFTGIINSHEALQDVIQWFYNEDITDKLCHEKIVDIVTASNLLEERQLTALCIEYLVNKLCLKNVFKTWKAAFDLGLQSLGQLCEWVACERFQDTLINMEETFSVNEEEMRIFHQAGLHARCSSSKWNDFITRWCSSDISRNAIKKDLLKEAEEIERHPQEFATKEKSADASEEILLIEDYEKKQTFLYQEKTDSWVSVNIPNPKFKHVTAIGIKIGNNTNFVLAEMEEERFALVDPLTGEIVNINILPLMSLIKPITGLIVFFTIQNTLYALTDKRLATMKYNIILWSYMPSTGSWKKEAIILDRFGEPCVAIEYIPRGDYGGFIITHTAPSDLQIHEINVARRPMMKRRTSPKDIYIGHPSFPDVDPAPLTLDILGTPDKLYLTNPTNLPFPKHWVYDIREDTWYTDMDIDNLHSGIRSSSTGTLYLEETRREEIFPTMHAFNPFTFEAKEILSMPHICKWASVKPDVQRAPSRLLDRLPEATLKDSVDVLLLDEWQQGRMINKERKRYRLKPLPEKPNEPPRPKSHVITKDMELVYRRLQQNLL